MPDPTPAQLIETEGRFGHCAFPALLSCTVFPRPSWFAGLLPALGMLICALS